MAKRKPLRSRKGYGGRKTYRKIKLSRTNDISDHTLLMMIILVLVVSVLSATMYLYAFYGGGYTLKSQETRSVTAEQQAISGVATIQIIRPPEGSK